MPAPTFLSLGFLIATTRVVNGELLPILQGSWEDIREGVWKSLWGHCWGPPILISAGAWEAPDRQAEGGGMLLGTGRFRSLQTILQSQLPVQKAATDAEPRAGGSERAPETQAPTRPPAHSHTHTRTQGTWGALVGGAACAHGCECVCVCVCE